MTQKDACALLDGDYEKVERLFAEYKSAGSDQSRKSDLAQAICIELSVHAAHRGGNLLSGIAQGRGRQQAGG